MQPYAVVLTVIGVSLLLFLAALVFLMAPATARRKETLYYTKYKYAHRGLHGDGAAENSLSAMKRAADAGFGIELDVRLSKDGEAVVFHDATLDRVCAVSGRVKDFTAEQLRALSLLGTGEGVPTLAEVLSAVGGRVPLLVEIKEEEGERGVAEAAMALLSDYSGEYIVEGFNPLSIRWMKQNRPDVIRGMLSTRFLKKKKTRSFKYFLCQTMMLNFLSRPDFAAYNHKYYGCAALYLCRLLGAPTFAWTVRSQEEERLALEHGFDTVIFEGYIPKNEQ